MAKQHKMAKVVEDLSDALNTLDDFEKFYAMLVQGRYGQAPGIGDLNDEDVERLHTRMKQTQAVLAHYVIGLANDVIECARANA